MNYWWIIVLLVIVFSDDARYFVTNLLNGLDTVVLFVLFLFALAWWSKT